LRQPLLAPLRLNEIWALDFMVDTLYSSRSFRTFNVIDEGNREALGIEVAHSIPSLRVIRVIEQLIELYGKPQALRLDNGSELTSTAFTEWCSERGIELRFNPTRQARSERVHRALQQNLSRRGARCLRIRNDRSGAHDHRRLATRIQRGAAARQPRPGTAPHLHAEASNSGKVYFRVVSLTGSLRSRRQLNVERIRTRRRRETVVASPRR
jgi:transposase InsO family protein